MHPLHNYNNNQRNQEGRNGGNKNKENRSDTNYSSAKSNKFNSQQEKIENFANIDKQDEKLQNKASPILNEKVFSQKCTINDTKIDNSHQNEKTKDKEDSSKEKNVSSNNLSNNSLSKNDSTESELTNLEENQVNSMNKSQNKANNFNNSQAQQNATTPSSTAPKFGTPVPNRIFVGGISTDTTETELQSLFSQFGLIKAVKIIIDREGVPKGYGFITYTSEEEANKVLKESDNLVLKNRKLNVAIAVKKQSLNTSLSNSNNLSKNFDFNHYFQNSNMFYMPNGISSIPTYINDYPISFPDTLYAYASPHISGLPHSNPPTFAYSPLVYRPSSVYFPTSSVSMHHHQNSSQNASHIPLNAIVQPSSSVGLQTNTQQETQYSNSNAIQQHQTTPQQQSQQTSHHHHQNSRMNSNNNSNNSNSNTSNNLTSNTNNNLENNGYQMNSQYHLHMNPGQHHSSHQHMHNHSHSHHQSHSQTNYNSSSSLTNSNVTNQQHAPVFINANGMPYIHPLSLQYNPGLATAISSVGGVPAFTASTTQPQTSLSHQTHYSHNLNSLASQHSQPVNQAFLLNPPNWVGGSQWRYHNANN